MVGSLFWGLGATIEKAILPIRGLKAKKEAKKHWAKKALCVEERNRGKEEYFKLLIAAST